MNDDLRHLGLLSIFHYILAGLLGLFSCFPLFYVGLGTMMINSPEKLAPRGEQLPPPLLGWMFVGFGSGAVIFGWTLAILLAFAGRFLKRRTHYRFCFAVAILSCLHPPLGTTLGVFTLIVLIRPSVKALFDQAEVMDVEPI